MSSVLRNVLTIAAIAASLGLLAVVVVVYLEPRTPAPQVRPTPDPLPSWAPHAGSPPAAPEGGNGLPGIAGRADGLWLDETAAATGIPRRALAAYAGAVLFKEEDRPECRLDWATLAGVGMTESGHGRHGGAAIDDDGFVHPKIFGVALDGDGVAYIADTDGGEYDGDAELDRAIGPMQLIPEAWRNWRVDANGDGVADPHHIDDAVLAAANYLCRASSAFDTEDGWRTGIRAYNVPEVYLGTVAKFARSYADAVSVGEPSTSG